MLEQTEKTPKISKAFLGRFLGAWCLSEFLMDGVKLVPWQKLGAGSAGVVFRLCEFYTRRPVDLVVKYTLESSIEHRDSLAEEFKRVPKFLVLRDRYQFFRYENITQKMLLEIIDFKESSGRKNFCLLANCSPKNLATMGFAALVSRFGGIRLNDYFEKKIPRDKFGAVLGLKIFVRLIHKFKELHAAKATHGDIKPDNIYVLEKKNQDLPEIMLGDFRFSGRLGKKEKRFLYDRRCYKKGPEQTWTHLDPRRYYEYDSWRDPGRRCRLGDEKKWGEDIQEGAEPEYVTTTAMDVYGLADLFSKLSSILFPDLGSDSDSDSNSEFEFAPVFFCDKHSVLRSKIVKTLSALTKHMRDPNYVRRYTLAQAEHVLKNLLDFMNKKKSLSSRAESKSSRSLPQAHSHVFTSFQIQVPSVSSFPVEKTPQKTSCLNSKRFIFFILICSGGGGVLGFELDEIPGAVVGVLVPPVLTLLLYGTYRLFKASCLSRAGIFTSSTPSASEEYHYNSFSGMNSEKMQLP